MWHSDWAALGAALLIVGCAGPQQQTSTSTRNVTKPSRAAARPASNPVATNRKLKPDAAIEKAKSSIAAQLQDPESVRFTDVAFKRARNGIGKPTDVVCGIINAKSSDGAYSAMPFVYLVDMRDTQIVDGEEIVAEAMYRRLCLGRPD